MSVRAHRVEEIKFGGESFNLWHDQDIVDYLDDKGLLEQLNMDMGGFIEVSIRDLRNMLAVASDEDTRKALIADMEWAEENECDTVMYYCF